MSLFLPLHFHQSFSFIFVHKSLTLVSHKKLSKYLLKYISRCVFRLQINFDALKNYIFHVGAHKLCNFMSTFVAFFPFSLTLRNQLPHFHRCHVFISCVLAIVFVQRIHFHSLMMREKNVQSINKPAYHMNVIACFRYFINTERNE